MCRQYRRTAAEVKWYKMHYIKIRPAEEDKTLLQDVFLFPGSWEL